MAHLTGEQDHASAPRELVAHAHGSAVELRCAPSYAAIGKPPANPASTPSSTSEATVGAARCVPTCACRQRAGSRHHPMVRRTADDGEGGAFRRRWCHLHRNHCGPVTWQHAETAQMGDVLRAIGLRKTFKDVEAVAASTSSSRDGERVGLLGPNGAGKTTSLLMILGAIEPTEGTIEIARAQAAAPSLEGDGEHRLRGRLPPVARAAEGQRGAAACSPAGTACATSAPRWTRHWRLRDHPSR